MAGARINIKRGKNKFYRSLKLDDKTRKTVKFFRDIKAKMLRDNDYSNKGDK